MKFFAKTKGAVSIFLIIILVPMLTVSSIMVDSSRIKLGKAMAESAGDLTLNTALTNYDSILKEVYGLFAMSQNEDDLTANLEAYFKKTIMASKLSEEAAEGFTAEIMDSIKARFFDDKPNGDFSDFMKINFSNFQAEKIENSQLSNPSVLKREIVEFMKYRAPISMGLGFIQSLKCFNNLEKKNDVVDKKTKYYDQQSDVMKKCKDLFDDIMDFLNTNVSGNGTELGINNAFIENLDSILNSADASYKDFNKILVKDVYEQDPEIGPPKHKITDLGYKYKVEEYMYGSVADHDPGNLSEDELISNFNNYLRYIDEVSPLINEISARAQNQFYDSQCVRQYNKSRYSDYIYNLDMYFGKLMTLRAEENPEYEYRYDADEYEAYAEAMEKAVEVFDKVEFCYLSYRTNELTRKATQLDTDVGNFATNLKDKRTRIENAIHALGNAISDANALINELNELEEKRQRWGESLDRCPEGDEFTTNTQAEFDNVSDLFNEEQILELKSRLEQIKNVLDDLYPHIEDYKYGSKKLYEIKNRTELKSAMTVREIDIPPITSVSKPPITDVPLESFQVKIFESNYVAGAFNGRNREDINFRDNPPEFFNYLYEKFYNVEEDEDKKEDFNDATNKVASNASNDVQVAVEGNSSTSFVFDKEALNLPSGDAGTLMPGNTNIGQNDDSDSLKNDGSKKALENNGSFITEMFSGFSELIRDFSIGIRDNLYVTEYGLKMFSYDTFENEIRYNMASIGTKDSLAGMISLNSSELNDEQKAKAITLTTEPINAEKNAAYGAEVEYIIFGLENAKDNVTAAYASIFGIRFVLNAIYAFTDAEIRTTSLSIATPISAATLGVIPVPLIQAVIQIAIALAETGYDFLCLREGMPIPIYKNKKTWVMKPSTVVSKVVDTAVDVAVDAAKQAVDGVIDYAANCMQDILDKTDEELTNLAAEELQSFETSLDEAFKSILDNAVGGVIVQATEACRQAVEKANAAGEDALTKVDEVKASLDASLNQYIASETSPELKEAKEAAKDLILNGSTDYVKSLIEVMQNKANNSLEQVQTDLRDLTGNISRNVSRTITGRVDSLFNTYKSQAIDSIKGSISEGQSALKESIDSAFGKFSNNGSGTGLDAGNPATSIFSFKYSDYLKLFLFIGTNINNGDGVIKRMADVIQVNAAQKLGHPVGENFMMSKAYTYARINADIEVKPLLITIPLIADTIKNDQTDTSWYKFEYSGIRGY
jgi:hypothetical protein